MPMLAKIPRRIVAAPIDHPLARQIESLPAVADIRSIFWTFHGALGAEGYRLGIKYLDAGIRIPRGTFTGRSNTNSKDPIHVLFPKFRPAPHPTDDKYPTPPISPEDAASCLAEMQAQQRKYKLFERESKDWKELGWPTKIDPFQLSHHASNIYVTPLDSRYYYLSIDDVNSGRKRRILSDRGIRPALILTSSTNPGTGDNDQWIIKIPKLPQFRQDRNLIDHFARRLPKPVDDPAIRALAQRLNAQAGDPDVMSCTRDFRLPGFYQLKEKYVSQGIYHVVTIKRAEDVICPVAAFMYHQIHEGLSKTTARRVRPISRRAEQHSLPVDAPATPPTIQSAAKPAGAAAPARTETDFYPQNAIYMGHAREVQALAPSDPKLAPGRSQSKFRVLQRLIVTGSLQGIDQGTDLFQDARHYLKDRERANLYIYLRTENAIDAYRDERPTQAASFHAHYSNARAYFQDHGKSARAAARRMFYMGHSRSVIERTMVEAGIPQADAFEWAKEGCVPSNRQIRADARYFEIWERCERSVVAPDLSSDLSLCSGPEDGLPPAVTVEQDAEPHGPSS